MNTSLLPQPVSRINKCLGALFLVLFGMTLPAQNQFKKWYFGQNAGLDFTTNPPSAITGAMTTGEGCASISDANANLLFYTDGSTIWNSQHLPMANGTGLTGNSSTTQSGIIVKRPGSSTIYYVFTLGDSGQGTLNYSEVNMTLAAGLGSVTVNKNILLSSNCSEKLTAARHCNGTDIWVLNRTSTGNVINAYLVTSAGVNMTPVASTLPGLNAGWSGNMKISPTGTKLGFAQAQGNAFDICDFNPSTGVASNEFNLLNNVMSGPYGLEFSPDGTKLYGAKESAVTFLLYQWDLCAGNNQAVAASLFTMTVPTQIQGMQLATDGRIYISRFGQQTLAVINNPNVYGAGCNYVHNGLSIAPNSGQHNLPSFITSGFRESFTYTSTSCQTPTVSFTAPSIVQAFSGCSAAGYSVSSVMWDFGDPASGPANNSTLINPTHIYPAIGNYVVKLILGTACGADTLQQTLLFQGPVVNITATPSGSFCSGGSVTLTASGATSYTWGTGAISSSLVITPTQVTAMSITGSQVGMACLGSASINILAYPMPTLSINASTVICKGQSLTLIAGGATTYSWNNGVQTATQVVTPMFTTTYYSVVGTNTPGGCSASKIMTVTLHPCTGIAENEAGAALVNVYPNPSMGQVTLENPQAGRLQVYDALGRLLLQETLAPGQHQIDLDRFSNGVLLLRWKDARGEQALRLLKTEP